MGGSENFQVENGMSPQKKKKTPKKHMFGDLFCWSFALNKPIALKFLGRCKLYAWLIMAYVGPMLSQFATALGQIWCVVGHFGGRGWNLGMSCKVQSWNNQWKTHRGPRSGFVRWLGSKQRTIYPCSKLGPAWPNLAQYHNPATATQHGST